MTSEQLLDVLHAVRDALDIPQGASAAGQRIRGKVLRERADQVVALLQACTAGQNAAGDVAGSVAGLRTYLARNPIRYVTVEQAAEAAAAPEPPVQALTRVSPGSALPLPRGGLPPWVGPSYLAKLWKVRPGTVVRWADTGLLRAQWQGRSRRFSREDVQEFVRYAISVWMLTPRMVVQHPEWADGMPVRIVSAAELDDARWQVTYRLAAGQASPRPVEAAPPCQGSRMVLRYPAETDHR